MFNAHEQNIVLKKTFVGNIHAVLNDLTLIGQKNVHPPYCQQVHKIKAIAMQSP